MSKPRPANPFAPLVSPAAPRGLPSPSPQPTGAVKGLMAGVNPGVKPPSPAKPKPMAAPAFPAPAAVGGSLFAGHTAPAGNPFGGAAGGAAAPAGLPFPPVGGGAFAPAGNPFAGGGAAMPGVQLPIMQAPVMPFQAAYQAAPVQTRRQAADLAKEHFKKGALQIVQTFVTQIAPQALGQPMQNGQVFLQQLQQLIQQQFQGQQSR